MKKMHAIEIIQTGLDFLDANSHELVASYKDFYPSNGGRNFLLKLAREQFKMDFEAVELNGSKTGVMVILE